MDDLIKLPFLKVSISDASNFNTSLKTKFGNKIKKIKKNFLI